MCICVCMHTLVCVCMHVCVSVFVCLSVCVSHMQPDGAESVASFQSADHVLEKLPIGHPRRESATPTIAVSHASGSSGISFTITIHYSLFRHLVFWDPDGLPRHSLGREPITTKERLKAHFLFIPYILRSVLKCFL